MKIIKNNLKLVLVSVITAIICISGTVLAVTMITADNITYIDKNNNTTTVENALDKLYELAEKEIEFGTPIYNTSAGDRIIKRETSLELSAGKYLIVSFQGMSFASSATTWPTSYSPNVTNSAYDNLSCTNTSCEPIVLSSYWDRVRSTGTISSNYVHSQGWYILYYLDLEEGDTVTAYNGSTTNSNTNSQYITLTAIPII